MVTPTINSSVMNAMILLCALLINGVLSLPASSDKRAIDSKDVAMARSDDLEEANIELVPKKKEETPTVPNQQLINSIIKELNAKHLQNQLQPINPTPVGIVHPPLPIPMNAITYPLPNQHAAIIPQMVPRTAETLLPPPLPMMPTNMPFPLPFAEALGMPLMGPSPVKVASRESETSLNFNQGVDGGFLNAPFDDLSTASSYGYGYNTPYYPYYYYYQGTYYIPIYYTSNRRQDSGGYYNNYQPSYQSPYYSGYGGHRKPVESDTDNIPWP